MRLDPYSLENQTWLARAYLSDRREADAVPLFEAAIAGGWNVARVEFAGALMFGNDLPADPPRAVALFRDAASEGYAPGEAGIGFAYEYGLGMPQDFNSAERWYRRALAHGFTDAKYQLDNLAQARTVRTTGPQRAQPQG